MPANGRGPAMGVAQRWAPPPPRVEALVRNAPVPRLQSRKWGGPGSSAGSTDCHVTCEARGARSTPALQGPLWIRSDAFWRHNPRTGWAQS